jgi:hypothetical protein
MIDQKLNLNPNIKNTQSSEDVRPHKEEKSVIEAVSALQVSGDLLEQPRVGPHRVPAADLLR